MDIQTLLAVLAASAVNAAIPGPCAIAILSRSATSGAISGISVVFGATVACAALAICALGIMAGTVHISQNAYDAMSWVGVGVLIATAFSMLKSNKNKEQLISNTVLLNKGDSLTGLALGLFNPYRLIFSLALLPQFLSADELNRRSAILLVCAVVVGNTISYLLIVFIGLMFGQALNRTTFSVVWIERIGAVLLIAIAVTVINFG